MQAIRSSSFIAALSAITILINITPASARPVRSVTLRPVATTGQSAPGAPPGTLFSSFGPGEFDGEPGIGADSTIGFTARLSDGTAGFWLDHGSGPELLALSGTPAPGTGPGVVFSQRQSESFVFTPPLLVPGHAVFFNTLAGPVTFTNDDGIWRTAGAGLALVARESDPAPGIPGSGFGLPNLRALDNAGRAIFSTALNSNGDESIWRAAPGAAPELLFREGGQAPGLAQGVVFATSSTPSVFPIIIGNSAGDLLFQSNLAGPGVNFNNDEALFIRDAATGTTRLFIRKGAAVPGMPGYVFREGASAGFRQDAISLNAAGRVAITTSISNGLQTITAFLSDVSGALTTIARSGDTAPGGAGVFDFFANPVMNAHGDIVFSVSATTDPIRPPLGLWIDSATGLRAIALPAHQAAGQPAGTIIQDVQFINGFNDDGFILFTAAITLPSGQPTTALLLADPAGDITIVARVGATITIDNTDHTISQISTRISALSAGEHAAFEVRFTDQSGAHIDAGLSNQAPCAPDINHDGVVGSQDFFDFLALFFAQDPAADFDHSGVVDSQDFFTFLAAFFQGC